MKIIVGLGNPGPEYQNTRHNVGFAVVDQLARAGRIRLNQRQYDSLLGFGRLAGEEVALLKPQTFMNLSGRAVYRAIHGLPVPTEDLLIIHDDLDLPLGRLRIRRQGSPGGHNGMKSIIACLGTEQFTRLRIGIGRPGEGAVAADYVLGDFTPEELPEVDRAVARAAEAVFSLVVNGVAVAMGKYNRMDDEEAKQKE